MGNNLVYDKSLDFGEKIVNLYKRLRHEKKEYILSDQILRCGTSIGANIAESEYAQSTPDFISKLSISQKEAGETLFWLKLLRKTDYITEDEYQTLKDDVVEILRIIAKILITLKNKNNQNT